MLAARIAVLAAFVAFGAHQQSPPDTEIFLAPLTVKDGTLEIGQPVNISNSPGYDNQRSFTPDGASILFTSVLGTEPGSAVQTDIYRYDIAKGARCG